MFVLYVIIWYRDKKTTRTTLIYPLVRLPDAERRGAPIHRVLGRPFSLRKVNNGKNGAEDLNKAIWYINLLIRQISEGDKVE